VPRIARLGPYRLFFHSNEGIEPPHVHVQRERKLAKFWLEPVGIGSSTRFSPQELRKLERLVRENQTRLLEAWHGYFNR
jgi:hypothetical protein